MDDWDEDYDEKDEPKLEEEAVEGEAVDETDEEDGLRDGAESESDDEKEGDETETLADETETLADETEALADDGGDEESGENVVSDYTESQSVNVRIVAPDDRVTSNFLQRTELAAILAVRAKQISSGSQVFVDIGDEQDTIEIAKKELLAYRNPLVVRRYIGRDGDGTLVYEDWKVRELGLFPITEIRDPTSV